MHFVMQASSNHAVVLHNFNLIAEFVHYKMQYLLRATKSWLRVNEMNEWVACADATR